MTFYYEGIARLDWGLGNPNRTAALIACLMIGVWGLAYFKKWGFWAAWILSTALGFLLVQTFSRGGFLAAGIGTLLLVLFARRPWQRLPAILIALSVTALVIYAFTLSAPDRVATSWQGDASVLNRLELWKSVPRMIADSPSGWGIGQSQHAYMQWYQSPERPERFLNLVSLHFTLLAELPWSLRLTYVVFWALAFLVTFPNRKVPELAVAFAVAVTFFVAGMFTHFADSWPVYLPLLLSIVVAMAFRFYRREWPSRFAIATATVFALLSFLPVVFSGSPQIPIQGDSRRVNIGKTSPQVWILTSPTILGSSSGKTLRQTFQELPNPPSWGFASSLSDIPQTETLILCGKIDPAALLELRRINPQRLILVNTDLFPAQVREYFKAGIEVIFGEFADSNTLSVWRQNGPVTIQAGEGNFLAEWPSLLLRQTGHQ